MPELPEVETVKNGLKKRINGKKILDVDVYWNGIIEYPSKEEFVNKIKNLEIKDITRRGKYIIFDLDRYYLISHLRMEGKYYIDKDIGIHDHVVFRLDDGTRLIYNDTRKFGKMSLIEKDDDINNPLNRLGYEPWDKELDIDYLRYKFNRKKAIKTLLLEQDIIAGIGNIYADEILYLCGINPLVEGYKLSKKNLEDIIINTRDIMNRAIELGGSSIHTYAAVDGITGRFQQELLVHGVKKCKKCGEEILKIVVNGRGTYYCCKCQK